MEVDINEVCRACLTHQEGMLSLYEIYEHGLTLAAILKSCINTEVREGDGFPSSLCDSCTLILIQFYNFVHVYEESDKQLKLVLQQEQDEKHVETAFSCDSNFSQDNLSEDDNSQVTQSDDLTSLTEYGSFQSDSKDTIARAVEETKITNVFLYDTDDNSISVKLEDDNVYFEESQSTQDSFPVQNYSARYECVTCGDVFLYKANFDEHITSCQPKREQKDGENETKQVLDSNVQEVTKYECYICGEAFMYLVSFESHMRVKHKIENISSEDYCTKLYIKIDPNSRRSKSRKYPPVQDRPFACDQCPRRFRQPYMLEHHKEIHSGEKKFVCEVCGKGFVRKTYLDDHMEGHSSVKKYVCKFCGKAFQRRTVLRAHKRTHTHPNFYMCDQCGRGFTSTSTLKTHKKLIHIRERNFKCMICMHSFPLKSTLDKHIRRHNNKNKVEKDFHCMLCDMQYRDKSSLKRHVEVKHLGKGVVVNCPDCPKSYTSNANLIKHRRKHHLDE